MTSPRAYRRVLKEFEVFDLPPAMRAVPAPVRFLKAAAAGLLSIASSARRALAARATPGAGQPPAPIEAWCFAAVEREVLAPIVEASGGRIRLVDANNPLSLWQERAFAQARVRAGLRLLRGWGGRNLISTARWGGKIRDAISALAELELHPPRLAGQVRTVLIANHYSPRQRALIEAAKAAGVRTLYIQHAAIGGYEGALDTDVALLHGWDSLRKYLSQGRPSGEVVVLGSVKVEDALHRRLATPGSVAVTPGLYDEPHEVEAAIDALVASDEQIEVRPHPMDQRIDAWRDLCRRLGASYSDSRTDPTANFLARQRRLIAGDSNILLEGLAVGIPTERLWPAEATSDQYGMLRAGLGGPHPDPRLDLQLRRFVQPPSAYGVARTAAALALDPAAFHRPEIRLRRRAVGPSLAVWFDSPRRMSQAENS